MLTSVTGQVALAIAIQIQATSTTTTWNRTLPNPGMHYLPSPLDVARQPNIHGKQARHGRGSVFTRRIRSARAFVGQLHDSIEQIGIDLSTILAENRPRIRL